MVSWSRLLFSLAIALNTWRVLSPKRAEKSLQKKLGSPNLVPMPQREQIKRDLSVAQERYVERIADAEKDHGHAHVSLLADTLGVTKPSVVQMTARLIEMGIVKRKEKEVTLTQLGQRLASALHGRHALLQDFMEHELGMDVKAANKEACRLEHVVSPGFVRGLRGSLKKRKDNRQS